MHAHPPRRRPVPTARLRALLAEPGGRRRLLRAMEDRLSPASTPDDDQLLLRAGALLDAEGLRSLGL
ncbi:MAG: hypothetical protein K0V04_44130 [Deltaproteobacteria bacterium]|nr:hypothetical protein [Deltaproteobacteria bacterium]